MPNDPAIPMTTDFKPDDMQACEACDKEVPIEVAVLMEDCWFCRDCADAWQKEFDACDHTWVHHTNSYGEPAGYCTRCAGSVALEDFQAMGFDVASVREDVHE